MEKVRFWLTGDVERLLEGTRRVCDRLDACLDADGVVIQAKKSDSLEVCREDGVLTIKYSILPELEEERLFFNECEKPMMETGSYRQILTAGTSW